MKKAGFTVTRVIFGVLVASVVAAAMLVASEAGSANAATCTGKCFAVAVSPAHPAPGATASFAFAITNEASTQQLGSVQISAPTGFMITGASGAASFTSSSALFLNLSLAPSATITLTLNAAVPGSGGTYQWGIQAKQSNNFNGTGNDFQLDPASTGNLSGSATGSLSLAFATGGGPANTAAGAVITSAFGSQGGPIKVEVLNGGQLDTGSTAAVTVAIGPNPPAPGTLSGTTTVDASAGVASFPNLSIDQPGMGYTLVATSPGIPVTTSATSTRFNILGSIQPCSTSCSASSSTTTTSVTVTTTSAIPAGDSLGFSLGGSTFTCNANYQQVSDVVSFDVFNSSGVPLPSATFGVSLEVFKSAVQASGRTGAGQWNICYASQQPFTAQPNTSGTAVIGGVSFNTGLLPFCSSTNPAAPCVQDVHKDNAGDIVIDFLATGDPVGWG